MTERNESKSEADKKAEGLVGRPDNYARMVFRPGHMARIGNADVDYMTVGSEKALKDAEEHGWSADPNNLKYPDGSTKSDADRRREADLERYGSGKDSKMGDKRSTGRGVRGGGDEAERDRENAAYDPYKDPTNPRPGEPDNAPLRNTPYGDEQTGDLPDPPTSPAENPERDTGGPVLKDLKEAEERSGATPGLEADEDRLERDEDGHLKGLKVDSAGKAVNEPGQGADAASKKDTGRKIETDEKSQEKAAEQLKSKGGSDKADKDEEERLRDKGAPPGARKG